MWRLACPLNQREQTTGHSSSEGHVREQTATAAKATCAFYRCRLGGDLTAQELTEGDCSSGFCRLCTSLAAAIAAISTVDESGDSSRIQVSFQALECRACFCQLPSQHGECEPKPDLNLSDLKSAYLQLTAGFSMLRSPATSMCATQHAEPGCRGA